MPYNSLSELPPAVKKLPKHAQEIWMAAFNSALKEYNDESKAFAVAWSAVDKAGYNKSASTDFKVEQVCDCKAYEENGLKFIEIPVSGVREDRDGDVFGKSAGEKMILAYKSGTVPMFSNHGLDEQGHKNYRWEDILAKFVDGWWTTSELDIIAKAQINPHNPKAEQLFNYVKSKMPVGFSIGGKIKSEVD